MNRAEKHAEILRLLELGYSKRWIAIEFGCTVGTIRNILYDPDMSKQNARRERYRGTCTVCGVKTDGSGGWKRAPTLCVKHNGEASRIWTRENVIDAIHRWNAEYGHPPTAREWPHTDHEWGRPAATSVYGPDGVFDSWASAIEAAGFKRPTTGRRLHDPTWTKEIIMPLIRQWAEDNGRIPSMKDWERSADGHPSGSTVAYHFGGWNKAITQAGFKPRKTPRRRGVRELEAEIRELQTRLGRALIQLRKQEGGEEMSEATTEIRLIHEGATVCLGVLYHEDCHLESDGQDVRVEVWYGSGQDEGLHGGYYRVVVPMISPDGLSEDEQMEIHPATMAEVIVQAELKKDAETFGWENWEIADIRAF